MGRLWWTGSKCIKFGKGSIKLYMEPSSLDLSLTYLFGVKLELSLQNWGIFTNNEIYLIHKGKLIGNIKQVSQTLNNAYINSIEQFSSINPTSVRGYSNINFLSALDLIIYKYQCYSSISETKNSFDNSNPLTLCKIMEVW